MSSDEDRTEWFFSKRLGSRWLRETEGTPTGESKLLSEKGIGNLEELRRQKGPAQ